MKMSDLSYNQYLEEQIELYIKNQLSDDEIDLLWADLIQNPYYLDYLKTAANLKEILSETNHKANIIQIPGAFKRYKRYWMAVAASLALLIGVISVVLNSSKAPDSIAVQPLQTLALQNVRSVQINNNTPTSRIQQAIGLVNEGKISQAMTIFKSLTNIKDNPSIGATAYIDMGIIHYNRKAFNLALDNFTSAINKAGDNVLLKEKAYWYSGNTYLKMGRKVEAYTAIRKAYDLNGAYRRITGKYLKKLNAELK